MKLTAAVFVAILSVTFSGSEAQVRGGNGVFPHARPKAVAVNNKKKSTSTSTSTCRRHPHLEVCGYRRHKLKSKDGNSSSKSKFLAWGYLFFAPFLT